MTIDRAEMAAQLAAVGLSSGQQVLVHSSLSSIGRVDGGPGAVIGAMLDVVGERGTVLAPTLTGSAELRPGAPLTFDVDRSRAWTGAIPEILRAWPGAVRSLHATHSVAAVGHCAEELTSGHLDTVTPCGADSPYGRLAGRDDAVVLLVGCDYESNTTLHHVEEMVGVDYHLHAAPTRASIRAGGTTFVRTFHLHRYGTPRCFTRIEPLVRERGYQLDGMLGEARVRLVRLRPLVVLATQVLRASPRFFVARE